MSRERMQGENGGAARSSSLDELKPGDVIRVRPVSEILAILDVAGTMDGLPFMPEMVAFCGREFRIASSVDKTCVEGSGITVFKRKDVVTLENVRCDGRAHGDCQKACLVYWRTAWLEPLGRNDPESTRTSTGVDHDLLAKTRSPDGRYFCQSTELIRITSALSAMARLRSCLREVLGGSYPIRCVARAFIGGLNFKIRRVFASKLMGKRRTPTERLGVQPGEVVQVRSVKEIKRTLDADWKNRGLAFTHFMVPFTRGQYRVKSRVDQMIIETTGEMRQLKNTVILEGVTCDGHLCSGVCPRSQFHLWREIWLRRVPPAPSTGASSGQRHE